MKLFVAICLAVVVVALAHESAVMDEATDLIQESALITAGAKTGAKVAEKVDTAAKVGIKAGVKARATVMIGTHELDAAKVSMARHKLKKITMKLGVRHPVFLGEAAGLNDFASDDARYVKGGYMKLEKILKKIDAFEDELFVEKQTAVDAREDKYNNCKNGLQDFVRDTEARDALVAQRKATKDAFEADIQAKKNSIVAELNAETSLAKTIRDELTQVDGAYKKHWNDAEDRHQIRNVLMQALWLVCTGFATFRHTEYCTNIRQQPDYDEPSVPPPIIGKADANVVAKLRLRSNNFGTTMQPVWEQQKLADAEEANQIDGDVDMEKGFVNNRAPWGVDPAGMETRGGGEEELGESNKEGVHLMTSQEMSARLTFLLESTTVPERINAPLTALIQALDSDDAAVQGGLVEALVQMDTEEGESQSNDDYEYYQLMINRRTSMYDNLKTAIDTKDDEVELFEGIESNQAAMDENRNAEILAHESWRLRLISQKKDADNCDADVIELEALIEAINEELVNIKRLNSLLRYLVVGDEAKCNEGGYEACNDEERGSCTWRTRGTRPVSEDDTSCETETGQDIPCDYTGAYPMNEFHPFEVAKKPSRARYENDAKFCACEYGFFPANGDKDCSKRTCSGYGRIRYPGNGQVALKNEGLNLRPTQRGGADTDFLPQACCSGERPAGGSSTEHGTCDTTEGKCTQCWIAMASQVSHDVGTTEGKKNVTPEMEDDGVSDVKMVPAWVRQTMPYHGNRVKCENWLVPKNPTAKGETENFHFSLAHDPNACNAHGKAVRNFMKYSYPGICTCDTEENQAWYGRACHRQKCKTNGVFYVAESSVVCYGRGDCLSEETGKCKCNAYSEGIECKEKRCTGYVKGADPTTMGLAGDECGKGLGECKPATGRCSCALGTSCGVEDQDDKCPGACIYNKCQSNCGGQNTDGATEFGQCDRFSGYCMCNPNGVFNGPDCEVPGRGSVDGATKKEFMLWASTFDKWGWSICSDGYLMTGLITDQKQTMDALYNIDQAICQMPFENNLKIARAVESHRCYHENWWKKFDTRGGKFCRRNYFLAGLFRSHCNSLYCIEMAKCCSVKRSVWTECKWESTKDWIENESGMQVSGTKSFLVGFFRNTEHTLRGISNLRQCTPIWWGQLVSYKTRFDN